MRLFKHQSFLVDIFFSIKQPFYFKKQSRTYINTSILFPMQSQVLNQNHPSQINKQDAQLMNFVKFFSKKFYNIDPDCIKIMDGFINIRLRDSVTHEFYICKIYFELDEDDKKQLQAQNQMLLFLAKGKKIKNGELKIQCEYPMPIKSLISDEYLIHFRISELKEEGVILEQPYESISARILTFIQGPLLSQYQNQIAHSKQILSTYAKQIAALTLKLSQYENQTIKQRNHEYHAEFVCYQVGEDNLDSFLEQKLEMLGLELRGLVVKHCRKYVEAIKLINSAYINQLPRKSIIHNDLNRHNVVVASVEYELHIKGIFDFSDYAYTYTVTQLAIAAVHLCLDIQFPQSKATFSMESSENKQATCEYIEKVKEMFEYLTCEFIKEFPLYESEVQLLWPSFIARLCILIINGLYYYSQDEHNHYFDLSNKKSIKLLTEINAYLLSNSQESLRMVMPKY